MRTTQTWMIASLAVLHTVGGCSAASTSAAPDLTSSACSDQVVGKVTVQVSTQTGIDPEVSEQVPLIFTYERGAPNGAESGLLSEVTSCVLGMLALEPAVTYGVKGHLVLDSRMDDQPVAAETGTGSVLVTDQAMNFGTSGGGMVAGFTGWYVDFAPAQPGSYHWTAPAHWDGVPSSSAADQVDVRLDIIA